VINSHKHSGAKPDKKRLGKPKYKWGIIQEQILKTLGVKRWTGFIWARTGSSSWLIWRQQWTFRFQSRHEISWPADCQL